jgi:hypothetical protein
LKYRAFALTLLLAGVFFATIGLLTHQALAVSGDSPATPPQWSTDVQVNPTPTEVDAGYESGSLAVSPIDPSFVVASYNVEDPDPQIGYSYSTDKGRSWSGYRPQGPWGTQNMFPVGDTYVAFNAAGVAYLTSQASDGQILGYFVLSSTNGITLSNALPIVVDPSSTGRDQSYMVVDQRPGSQYAGSIYIFWRYIDVTNTEPRIVMRYSRDGGQSWSSDIVVSDPSGFEASNPWATIAPDGSIYLAYTQRDPANPLTSIKLFLDRSTDGGATWGTDKLITGAPITPAGGFFKHIEIGLEAAPGCVPMETFQRTFITTSRTNSNEIYAVWNDGRWDAAIVGCFDSGKHSDIAFSRSTDAGQTWSNPIRLNDDPFGNGLDQFDPMLGVGHDGTLGVIWYDRRYDSNIYFYNAAYTQSRDGGLTWSANQRISDVSSDPSHRYNNKGVADLGFRKPLIFGRNFVLAGWLDTRLGTQQGNFFVDSGNVCTMIFTDVPPDSTFYADMRCLACKDIVSGYACGGPAELCDADANPYFRPDNNVTRGQLAKIVSNSAGFNDTVSGQAFEDVPPGSTFYTFTQRLSTRGVMSGYPCGGEGEPCVPPGNRPYFRPNNNATRGQITKIVSQAAGYIDPPGAQIFEDVPPGSTFYTYTQRLASRSIMQGYPCGGSGEPCNPPANRPYFRPYNNATRGQTSKIVSNTFFPDCNPPRR